MFASRALRLRAGLASGAGCCAFRRAPARCAENEQPPPEPEPWFERIAEALDDAVDIATTAVGYHGGDYAKEDIEEGPGRYAAYARRFAQVRIRADKHTPVTTAQRARSCRHWWCTAGFPCEGPPHRVHV